MRYFIADTHFHHKGSLKWNDNNIRSKFKDIDDMNNTMISNWNNVVKPEDEVYFLGDFAYKCSKTKAESTFWLLNGKKHLIKGNHDHKIASKFDNCWESIQDRLTITIKLPNGCDKDIVLDHYPLLSWRNMLHGAWHLHGHCHGCLDDFNKGTKRYDVGVESNNYTPISEEDIINKLNK